MRPAGRGRRWIPRGNAPSDRRARLSRPGGLDPLSVGAKVPDRDLTVGNRRPKLFSMQSCVVLFALALSVGAARVAAGQPPQGAAAGQVRGSGALAPGAAASPNRLGRM